MIVASLAEAIAKNNRVRHHPTNHDPHKQLVHQALKLLDHEDELAPKAAESTGPPPPDDGLKELARQMQSQRRRAAPPGEHGLVPARARRGTCEFRALARASSLSERG